MVRTENDFNPKAEEGGSISSPSSHFPASFNNSTALRTVASAVMSSGSICTIVHFAPELLFDAVATAAAKEREAAGMALSSLNVSTGNNGP